MIFASRMVSKALEYPPSMAALGVFPSLSSSLILSNMRTLASTAIPIVRMIPAMPGRVRVALRPAKAPIIIIRFRISAKSAIAPDIL